MIIKKYILLLFINLQFVLFLNAQSIEYTIKASFIEKFARFTEWQPPTEGNYFVISVLGESPFKGELEKMAQNVKLKNKPIKINYIHNYNEADNCQVLFICASEKNKVSQIVNFIKSKNILTVSDSPGFCKKGVHFNFYIDDSQTIKYEVNYTTIKATNLMVDIQVLNFGKIIR
jgi:hypothetical protein